MIIKKSEFVISAPRESMCPKDGKPEYTFIGRSNVGKSSLINMLCNHKGLAKTSATPGKTLLINHFIINDEWYLVDLPGYGFAKRSKSVQQQLDQMIRGYILQRQQLVNVFVLIDIRHEQQKNDREFIDWLGMSGIPFSIVFTKADKLSPSKAKSNVLLWMNTLKDAWEELPPYFITSSDKKSGRDEVLNYIEKINNSLDK
ncbi:MAG: YihA family ribosome biogenesis GTP-binding protein [Prevotella sp.]|nr:YihA family ribosome biogenesis GTP-binding protein [Prevotella sp.]